MQLITGGAFSGKRRYVRQQHPNLYWHSAYDGASLVEWSDHAPYQAEVLVMEGWELWQQQALQQPHDIKQLRADFYRVLQTLLRFEQQSQVCVILIFLEMGRGVVPMTPQDRSLRDLNGWLTQDAASLCDSVIYLWHGLARPLK